MASLATIQSSGRLPFAFISEELEQINSSLIAQVERFNPQLRDYFTPICAAPGKRIRPALALLGGKACDAGVSSAQLIKLGVVLELIHMATLVHDDIIDGASTRRGVATPNATHGNAVAVLLGDAMFAHAMSLATEFDSTLISRKIGDASRIVCEGEILQGRTRYDYNMQLQQYYDIIGMKTGALFACACEVAAILAGASEQMQQSMYEFGMTLGIAYQVYDDCLDLVGNEAEAGKTLGTDVDRGKLTLPMLLFIAKAEAAELEQFKQAFSNDHSLQGTAFASQQTQQQLLQQCIDIALQLNEKALNCLQGLADSPSKQALVEIVAYFAELIEQSVSSKLAK